VSDQERSYESDSPGGGERSGPGGRRRFIRRARVCTFCAEKTTFIDHKQVEMVKRHTAENGRIRSRRETGTCSRHQRMLAIAVKRARHLALVPFRAERVR
jgi:small subunit ribosomal protein S18